MLDSQQNARGGYDRLARENYSTLLWAPGEIITDGFAVPVAADAPDGIYTLSLGWYREVDGQAASLPILDPESASEQLILRGYYHPVGWSPDGAWIYATPDKTTLVRIPVDGGAPQTLLDSSPFEEVGEDGSLAQDGRLAVQTVIEIESDLWLVDGFDPEFDGF